MQRPRTAAAKTRRRRLTVHPPDGKASIGVPSNIAPEADFVKRGEGENRGEEQPLAGQNGTIGRHARTGPNDLCRATRKCSSLKRFTTGWPTNPTRQRGVSLADASGWYPRDINLESALKNPVHEPEE